MDMLNGGSLQGATKAVISNIKLIAKASDKLVLS